MRLWFSTSANTWGIGPIATSVAAHAMLVVGAVYGSGVSARALEQEFSKRVYFLPPPDRLLSSKAVLEHLYYVDLGSGSTVSESPDADSRKLQAGGQRESPQPGGDVGKDMRSQVPTVAVPSEDSVYSVLDVEESAVRTEGSAAPIYPPELVKASVEGAVLTRYVVDTTGYADSATIQVLRSTHPAFVSAVLEALPRMRFSAASVHGKRVRQIVEQNFEFKITPPTVAPAEHTQAKPIP